TRGRSDVYDILTHLTFLFIESQKICRKVLIDDTDKTIRDWVKLEAAVGKKELTQAEREVSLIHMANILGRSFEETMETHQKLGTAKNPDRFLGIVYWLGKLRSEEHTSELQSRENLVCRLLLEKK